MSELLWFMWWVLMFHVHLLPLLISGSIYIGIHFGNIFNIGMHFWYVMPHTQRQRDRRICWCWSAKPDIVSKWRSIPVMVVHYMASCKPGTKYYEVHNHLFIMASSSCHLRTNLPFNSLCTFVMLHQNISISFHEVMTCTLQHSVI